MASGGTKVLNSATPPPRLINVKNFAESRAAELDALHSIMVNRLSHDFRTQRNKRRRTTGFFNRSSKNRSKKQKFGKTDENTDSSTAHIDGEKDRKTICRRIRRRMEFRENPVSGFGCSGDGTKRLRTHCWHAKRFTMTKKWGFYLPLGLHGSGRGSRAALKWLKHGTVIHDASYCSPIQLEGSEDSLLAILKMVLAPFLSGNSVESSRCVLYGVCHGSGMLHHVGAPVSQPIAPVTYMWQPSFSDDIDIDVEKDPVTNGIDMHLKNECSTSFRRLWLWIHAAALNEGLDALRSACKIQMQKNDVLVNCLSLEGQLGKLEVMGSKALQLLRKLLHPVSGSCSTVVDAVLRKCRNVEDCFESQLSQSFALEYAEHLPSRAILPLAVHDPRDLPMKESDRDPKASSKALEGDLQQEDDSKETGALNSVAPNQNNEELLSIWLKPDEKSSRLFFSDSKSIWDYHERMNPPIEESLLCAEKHQRRLAFFCIDMKNSAVETTATEKGFAKSCTILLLKNGDQRSSSLGWSVVLPLSWVKAFWISLVSHGAHAIGLREKRWIACDARVPTFPFDFPDCEAYSRFMALEVISADEAAELRPCLARPLRVPIPSPWDCVKLAIEGITGQRDTQISDLVQCGEMVAGKSSESADSRNGDLASSEQDGSFFRGFIARTSCMVSSYLNEIHGGHLLLFLNMTIENRGFSELMNQRRLSWGLKGTNDLPADRKLCFVRVLLCARKEGVFEEGAVVCAPILADLSFWSSSSNDQQSLQIPQSLIRTYFVQQPSGKWEMQIPKDPVTRQSHRWPIGFVTSGFVRGSSKPVAEAFCEATLLARLRGEQWKEMQEKGRSEIFVLVRNLRSSAYRPGFATIVLENQDRDLEFM